MLILKKYWVWIILGLTLLVSYWTAQQEGTDKKAALTSRPPLPYPVSSVNGVAKTLQNPTNTSAKFVRQQGLIQRPYINDVPANLFSTLMPVQALVNNKTVVKAPSTPQVPANPYTFTGKIVEGDHVYIFLSDGVNNHAVTVGDMLDDAWKVRAISPPEMILENVVFKTEVTIQIGALS